MSIQVTNFGNTLGLPAGYVEAITAIVDEEIKFCVQNPTTNGTTGQVAVFNNPQQIRSTNVLIDNTDSLSVGGTLTVGNNVPATNYTLPSAIGVPQQVLQVPAVGNELEWANNSTTVPTFLNTLTVDELSQGPNALTKNYTLPNYAPIPNSVLASATTYIMTFAVNASISFRVDTINNGTIQFTVPIPIGVYLISDILLDLELTVRRAFDNNNVIADIIFGYDSLTDRFSMTLLANTTPSNFINFWWEAYQVSPVPNNNNLFGIGVVIEPRLQLPPISVATCQNAPIGVSLGTDCIWRDLASVQIPAIQSDSGASSIQCEDVGIGQNGIVSYGNYNVNNGSINNCGNINALDNCNITTNTTQIVNGLSELNINIDSLPRITQNAIKSKLECGTSRLQLAAISDLLTDDTSTYFASQNVGLTKNMAVAISPDTLVINQDYGVVNRLVVDDTTTALFSKNALSGPNGSSLSLNNNGTFTIASYFAGNGLIDCQANSMAIVGPQAKSACVYTDATITTSLFNGTFTASREIMDATSQTFKDGNSVDRIKLDNTNVTINGLYTLPTNAGVDGEVLTRATGTSTVWNRPQIYSIFSQIVNQTVANTVVETTIIGGGTPTSTLTIAPNFFTAGMAFRYSTGGLFQTSANNISARFRLRNSGVLFDSGLLVFSNRVIPPTPWNVEATFAYMGGTVMVTNFNFQYNAGNDMRGFTSQQSNNTFNATISNTLDFTIQWSAASVNNSITTNYGIVQKIY